MTPSHLLRSGVPHTLAAWFILLLPLASQANTGWPQCDSTCYVTGYAPVNDTVACLETLDAYTCAALTVVDTCTLAQTISAHVLGNGADSVTTSVATTALGIGEDGALRMYGMAQSGVIETDYFVETEVGLTLVQYANDVAVLTGEVAAITDATQRFEVFIVYENRVAGSEWGGGFKHAMGCMPPTDTWDIYTIKPDQSHLVGRGSLEGSLIRVTHAPSSQYFGFQVGEGANDHNCNYGAGGWFSWEGSVCGTPLAGAMGDVIVDLDSSTDFDPCNARSTAYFSAYIEDCGVFQYSFDIVRHDDTAPLIAGVPADTIQDCALPLEVPTTVTVTDDCPEPGYPALTFEGTFEVTPMDGHCRTYEQRWSAVDACGNVSEASRFIHVFDNDPPAMVGAEILELECDAWPGGNEPPLADLMAAGIIDVAENCELDTVLIDYGVMSGGCYYDHVLEYTPIDACGNVGESLYQIVVIHDTTDPVFHGVPADTTVSCTTDASAVNAVPTATDNCDPEVAVTVEVETLDDGDGCPETYVLRRVFTTVDCGYNHARDTQYVHVVDTAAPVLTLVVPEDLTLSGCHGAVDVTIATLGDALATVQDDCGEVEQSLTHADVWSDVCTTGSGAQGGSATLTRTWTLTATDCSGNSASLSAAQVIAIEDDVAPSLTGAPVVDLACGAWEDGFSGAEALAAGFISASDNCLLDSVSVAVIGELSGGCSGTFEVAYTAVDACGTTTTLGQIVELFDSVPPVFTLVPADGVLSCDGDPAPFDPAEAAATDDCGEVTITASDELVLDGCPATAVWERTWTATDDCGNMATHLQRFQREDNVAPVITAHPADTMVSCALFPFDAASVLATDDCDAAPVISHVDDTVSFACAGSFVVERHILATDCAGNSGEVIQTISVSDTTDPVLTTSGVLVELSCTDWACDIDHLVDAGFVSATDNCGDVTLTVECLAMSGGCIEPFGTYTLLYTATDPCGNTAEGEQILTLVDLEAPELALTCPDSAAFELDATCGYVLDAPGANTAFGAPSATVTDNCDAAPDWTLTWSDGPAQSACGEGGSITVLRTHILSAEDRCGNTAEATCTQVLVFHDVHGPALDITPAPTYNFFACLSDTDTSAAALGTPVVLATDACGGDVTVEVTYADVVSAGCAADDGLPEGNATLERTFTITATDCEGNVTVESTTQIANFFDIEAPNVALACPADTTLSADADCGADLDPVLLGMPAVTAADACDSEVAWTVAHEDVEVAGACAGERLIERTFTITALDDCGNAATAQCVQSIQVVDDIAPTLFLTCPPDVDMALDADCSWDGDAGQPEAVVADGCDPAPVMTLTYVDQESLATCEGDDALVEGSYSFIRTWTLQAEDACGNFATVSCDQLIELHDVTAPEGHVLEVLPTDTLFLDADCLVDLAPQMVPTSSATDACDSEVALTVLHSDDPADFLAQAGSVSLELDTVAEGGIAGMTTYRLYAALSDPADLVSAVVGEGHDATWITSSMPFYQHPLGGVTPGFIDPILFDPFPELEFDSWVTVGIDRSPDLTAGQEGIQIVESSAWVSAFEQGASVALNSGYGDGWFALPTAVNGLPDGDGRVLLAQFTTAGHVSGQLYLQVFEGGLGGADTRHTLSFGNACTDDDGVQEGSYTFVRTWQSVAADDCGNADTAYSVQNIAVLDTLAPQWTETCGLANGEEILLPCAGPEILDFDPLPLPCNTEAVDQCDTEVGIARFDDIPADAPTGEVCNVCAPSDPQPFAAGVACDGSPAESMRLFNFNGMMDASFTLEGGASRFAVGCDSTLSVELDLTDGQGGGFHYSAQYEGGWDWAAWNGSDHPFAPEIAGSYKLDCPEILPGQPVWLDWHYFYLTGGTLSGTGAYAGSEFTLGHQPANAFFGFQVGLGANNKNDGYGASGWFQWEGQLVVDGQDMGAFASSGDIFVDLDCCLPWQVEHDYVAQDDCGNAIAFEYTVTNSGEVEAEGAGLSGGTQHTAGPVVIGGMLDDKKPFRIVGLMPNPTSDFAHLQFEVETQQRLTVRLHAISGEHLMDLFDATAEAGVQYQLPIDVAGLSSGLYQLRISGSAYSEVRKLLVSE